MKKHPHPAAHPHYPLIRKCPPPEGSSHVSRLQSWHPDLSKCSGMSSKLHFPHLPAYARHHFSNRIEVRAKKNKFDLNIQGEIMTMYHYSVLSTKIFSSRSLEISQKFSSQGISLVATNDTKRDNNQQQSIFISAPKKKF